MGNKKLRDDGRVNIHVRMDKDLYEKLAKAADERVVGVNLIITKAIEHYLVNLTPIAKFMEENTSV